MADDQTTIPYGFCQCGCGQKTKLASCTSSRRGWIKGHPLRYINRHHIKRGSLHPMWNGGRYINSQGYVLILCPDHPQHDASGYVREHILVVEKAFGRYLRPKEVVHHIDEDITNNAIGNLMVFATQGMHINYHIRLRAFQATGHWDWLTCNFCHEYDDPINLVYSKSNRFHFACRTKYNKEYMSTYRK